MPSDQTPVDAGSARALWFAAAQQAELRAEDVPPPGPGEIVVRALSSLVSAGTEMQVYRGTALSEQLVGLPTTGGTFPFPIKFAYQIVGEVEAAGSDCGYAVGDRVFSYHPHQERFCIGTGRGGADDLASNTSLVAPVPADLSPERAAFANLYSVAYNALLDTPVHIGDVVVVSGLGVIGSFAGHLARADAGRLILVDPIAERRERAAWIGADAIVHPDEAAETIRELSDGRGNDLWIEASGAPPALQAAIDNTGQEGTITVLSMYGTGTVELRLVPEFHLRRQRIVSSQIGAVGSGLQPRWTMARRMAVAMDRLGTFDVEPLITHRVPFSDAPEAYRLIDQNPTQTLGVLLDYSAT